MKAHGCAEIVNIMDRAPFHADELAMQARSGAGAKGTGIRDFMPEQHRSFFASLSHVFLATTADGWPLATLLEGEPGFLASPDGRTLAIGSLPGPQDPAAGTLHVGQQIGLLGIDLATRRRNRVNGVVSNVNAGGFSIAVQQSFGNCSQYIQRRAMSRVLAAPAAARKLLMPDDRARVLIERADTFFVATRSRATVGVAGGADISHRGGQPGFVRLEGDTLGIPDFRGNRYFNTLGNILGEPRAALMLLDFATGDVLQLQGLASIDWGERAAARVAGAERVWRFRITQGWYRAQASTLRGAFIDYAPTTLGTGTWDHGP
jgi:predicted pyridoxine 5'-phosphate oxidase superfamily flavin-nucleotide-binding protein